MRTRLKWYVFPPTTSMIKSLSTQFSVGDTIVIPASSVCNIGVMFDNTMSMKNQVTSLCKAAHFHLRNIGRIRKSITYEACEKLIHALITSRLDYCNATLYGVTDGQHQRLQKDVQYSSKNTHVNPTIRGHWNSLARNTSLATGRTTYSI